MFIYDDDDTNALEGLGSYNNTNAGVWYSTGGQLWGKEANKHLNALQEIQSRGLSEEKQVQAIVDYERKNKVSFTRREMQAAGIAGAVIGAVLTLPIGGLGAYIGADIGSKMAHKKELRRYKKELLQDAQDSDAQDSDAKDSDAKEGIGTYNNSDAGVWYTTGGQLWGKEANKHLDALQEIQSKGLSKEEQVRAIADYERKHKVSFTRREMQAAGIAGAVIGAVLTLPIGGLGAIAGKDIGNRIAHKKELRRYKKELLQDAQDSDAQDYDAQDYDAQESAIDDALEALISE